MLDQKNKNLPRPVKLARPLSDMGQPWLAPGAQGLLQDMAIGRGYCICWIKFGDYPIIMLGPDWVNELSPLERLALESE